MEREGARCRWRGARPGRRGMGRRGARWRPSGLERAGQRGRRPPLREVGSAGEGGPPLGRAGRPADLQPEDAGVAGRARSWGRAKDPGWRNRDGARLPREELCFLAWNEPAEIGGDFVGIRSAPRHALFSRSWKALPSGRCCRGGGMGASPTPETRRTIAGPDVRWTSKQGPPEFKCAVFWCRKRSLRNPRALLAPWGLRGGPPNPEGSLTFPRALEPWHGSPRPFGASWLLASG